MTETAEMIGVTLYFATAKRATFAVAHAPMMSSRYFNVEYTPTSRRSSHCFDPVATMFIFFILKKSKYIKAYDIA